jgi:predicted membrane-bound spermidine synthase
MAGLAVGNALVLRFGHRIRAPVRVYAGLELLIAASGIALVLSLPSLGGWLAPWLGPFLRVPWIVNPLRLAIGFVCLLAPATAMGATLPLLVKALRSWDPNFGSVLGRLYGWNTLGAVLGAVAGEVALLQAFGIRGSALVAGGLNLLAAAVAWRLSRRLDGVDPGALVPHSDPRPLASGRVRPLLAAAFLSGGILLALEVVWFRFLLLFVVGSARTFALMLAVVLAAIGVGGRAAGAWLRRDPGAFRFAAGVAFLAGGLVVLLYAGFDRVIAPYGSAYLGRPSDVLWLSTALTLPVALLSGVLFTLTGAALGEALAPETRAAGWLTLANTLGSGLGSLVAGFLLLPGLGMERSLVLLAACYGPTALLLYGAVGHAVPAQARTARYFTIVAGLGLAAAMALFPHGSLRGTFVEIVAGRFGYPRRAEIAAIREGRAESLLYLRHTFAGETSFLRLVTNGFSMSASEARVRRYMKLFVYWPVALGPAPRRALLISYGLGVTAKALTDTTSLEHIDVVDTSREILAMSDLVYPDPLEHPLSDPRVEIHIEDGRYFLETTERRYDLITGEPPPPGLAGVVNLYTREYFQLAYDRLTHDGILTYWLPVHSLDPDQAKAIIRAFCDVFADCSLWNGIRMNWMLVGSRDARWPGSEDSFRRQWEDPAVAPEMHRLGFERPEQLGATFIADPSGLRKLTRDSRALVDDFPKRLDGSDMILADKIRIYTSWIDAATARRRFEDSEFIRRVWPPVLREATLAEFDHQRMLEEGTGQVQGLGMGRILRDIHAAQMGSSLETLVLWKLGFNDDEVLAAERSIANGSPHEPLLLVLAARALAERDFQKAASLYERAAQRNPQHLLRLVTRQIYALCMAGRSDEAQAVADRLSDRLRITSENADLWKWLGEAFGIDGPSAGPSGTPSPRAAP